MTHKKVSYRSEDPMNKFSKNLRKHVMEITARKKKCYLTEIEEKKYKKKKKQKKNVGICAKENSMTCLMRMRTVAGCDHCHNSQIYWCNTQYV